MFIPNKSFIYFALLYAISLPSLFLHFFYFVELRRSFIPLIALILSPGFIYVLFVILLLLLSLDVARLSSRPVRQTNSDIKYIISISVSLILLNF